MSLHVQFVLVNGITLIAWPNQSGTAGRDVSPCGVHLNDRWQLYLRGCRGLFLNRVSTFRIPACHGRDERRAAPQVLRMRKMSVIVV